MTKWGGRPHWEYDATYLGADEHGDWLGVPVGTTFSRPGRSYVGARAQVVLVPHGSWWLATFHDAADPGVLIYVDMATPATWDGADVGAVDLDLDVVRLGSGEVYVDDEDEFAEHQVAFGYPAEVVSAAESSCAWVLEAVRERRPPFDGATSGRWFDRFARLGPLDG